MTRVNGTNTERPRNEPDACVQERSTTLESDEDDGERDGGNKDADRGGDDDDAEDITGGGDSNGNDGTRTPPPRQPDHPDSLTTTAVIEHRTTNRTRPCPHPRKKSSTHSEDVYGMFHKGGVRGIIWQTFVFLSEH